MAKVKGLDKLIKDLAKLGEEGIKTIAGVTEANARDIEVTAKQLAPIDSGKLRQSIKSFEVGKLKWKVLANATGLAPYAAYQEFGTGGLVEVPAELAEMAIKFKGKGIKKVDLRPQPFMYPALVKGRKQYVEDLKSELEVLTKKV
ncbi:MAG: HK97 gp10 family phage protein [Gelidibacter sp.]|nr:HK97 gp10 family phage protein [Gelidibacter sp.]